MTNPGDPLLVLVTRIEGKVDTLAERVSSQGKQHSMSDAQLQRAMDGLRESIKEAREEARRETTGATSRLEGQIEQVVTELREHEEARNPHSNQEEWIRRNHKTVADELGLLRNEMSSARGVTRVLIPVVAAVLSGVLVFVITRALGG